MDKNLVPYLTATDPQARENELSHLITFYAAPLIRKVLRRRLCFYLSPRWINQHNHDAEDLFQEAITRVVQCLTEIQESASNIIIENFDRYVYRLASNICIDFLRAKSPLRTRLKDSLRALFRRTDALACWEVEGRTVYGLTAWSDSRRPTFSSFPAGDMESNLELFLTTHFTGTNITNAPLSEVVIKLLNWIGSPVTIDVLVRMVAHLRQVRDQQSTSLDHDSEIPWEDHGHNNLQISESKLHARDLLERLWSLLSELPSQQRDAFVLGFEDHAGQDLFTLLLASRSASWQELAKTMDRSVEDLLRLQTRMPMDCGMIATELGASRERVYKWRFRAIRKIRARLNT